MSNNEEIKIVNTEKIENEEGNIIVTNEAEMKGKDASPFEYVLLPDGTYSVKLKDRARCPANIILTEDVGGRTVDPDFAGFGAEAFCEIPTTVSTIADRGFSDCKELTSIFIPKSVIHIGDEAFAGSGLVEITVDEENPVFRSVNNCIIRKEDNVLIAGCAGSIIPDDGSVTSIGDGAFSDCDGLEEITIPGCVRSIGQLAFYKCDALRSVTLEEGVAIIYYGAFSYCKELSEITVPNTVTDIGAVAFANCTKLIKAVLPVSVRNVGGDIFANCSPDAKIFFEGSEKQWRSIHRRDIMDSGYNGAGGAIIFVEDENEQKKKKGGFWARFFKG